MRERIRRQYVYLVLASFLVLVCLSGCVSNTGDRALVEQQHPVKAEEQLKLDPYPHYQTPVPPPEPMPETPPEDLPIEPLGGAPQVVRITGQTA